MDDKNLNYNMEFVRFVINCSGETKIRSFFSNIHPADAADIIEDLYQYERAMVIRNLAPIIIAKIWRHLDQSLKRDVIPILSDSQLMEIYHMYKENFLAELDSNNFHQILSKIEPHADKLDPKDRSKNISLIIDENVVKCPSSFLVSEAINLLKREHSESRYSQIFLIDEEDTMSGAVHVNVMIVADHDTPLTELSHDVPHIQMNIDQEELADLFTKYKYDMVAVVTGDKKLIGVIHSEDILDFVETAHERDILSIGGANNASLHESIFSACISRSKWLSATLVSAFCTIVFTSNFQEVMKLVSVIIPVVASFGGNAGIQSAAVVISAINAQDIRRGLVIRTIVRESTINFLNGLTFGSLISAITFISGFGREVYLSAAIVMPINMSASGFIGAAVPFLMKRLGYNPATGTGPVLTTLVDIISQACVLTLVKKIFMQ